MYLFCVRWSLCWFFILLSFCTTLKQQVNGTKEKRYAYVTVHYEGTSRDEEYVLGIQVLMKSLRITKTKNDLVILTSETVSERSKQMFRRMGCRVLDVKNIDNPFLGKTLKNKNFIYTLNKLHVWNLLEYDRVIYLDADNVVIRNIDELFHCGKFCAVFMNPCHFHTGLMVITPDPHDYRKLIEGLSHLQSFDGADQGFLSSFYSDTLRYGPLFQGKPLDHVPPAMRLPVGYNINHKYFYEQYHWKLFYLHHFADLTETTSTTPVVVESARFIPAVTVGFPMAPVLKPWYWWSCFIMDLNWVWQDIRSTLTFSEELDGPLHDVLHVFFFFLVSLGFMILSLVAIRNVFPEIKRNLTSWLPTSNRMTQILGGVYCTASVLLACYWAAWMIPHLINPVYGFSLFMLNQHIFLIFCSSCLSYWMTGIVHPKFPPVLLSKLFWKKIALSILGEIFTLYLSSCRIFPNILWRLIVLAIATLTWFTVQFSSVHLAIENPITELAYHLA